MPTEIDDQLINYFAWLEQQTGYPLRRPPDTPTAPSDLDRRATSAAQLPAVPVVTVGPGVGAGGGRRRRSRSAAIALIGAASIVGTLIIAARPGHAPSNTVSSLAPSQSSVPADSMASLLAPGASEVLPASPLSGRFDPTAVWTGRAMLIWGGATSSSTDNDVPLADGAAYDPVNHAWTIMPAAPISARSNPAAVWTGTEMLIWGGGDNGASLTDGAAYNPTTNQWRTIPSYGLTATVRPTTVWTGTEMIVLEGINGTPRGAAFNPTTNTWRAIAEPPGRSVTPYPHAVWTGQLVVAELAVTPNDDPIIAAYNPGDDIWEILDAPTIPTGARPNLLWTGTEVLVLAGPDATSSAWNESTGQWRSLTAADPTTFGPGSPVWTGNEALFWTGGTTATAYNPTTDTWRNLDAGTLTRRSGAPTLWADGILLSWSGFENKPDGGAFGSADGIALRPAAIDVIPPQTVAVPADADTMVAPSVPVAASADDPQPVAPWKYIGTHNVPDLIVTESGVTLGRLPEDAVDGNDAWERAPDLVPVLNAEGLVAGFVPKEHFATRDSSGNWFLVSEPAAVDLVGEDGVTVVAHGDEHGNIVPVVDS